jgi:transcriptional regulator with XRE-family HTH domain
MKPHPINASPMTSAQLAVRLPRLHAYDCAMRDATAAQQFATLIRTAIQKDGRTQEELETTTGISRSTWSRWVRGLADRPDAEHVRIACKTLGIDPRRAAIALGYLTEEEVTGTPTPVLNPEVEDILNILQDPKVDPAEKQAWINYLKFLRDKAHRQAS